MTHAIYIPAHGRGLASPLCASSARSTCAAPPSYWNVSPPTPDFFPERHPEEPVLESAISLSAAVADYLARSEYIVEFFAAGPDIYRFEAGRSLAYLEDILDVLSCLATTTTDPFPDLANVIENEKLTMSSAIVVLLDWDAVGLAWSAT